MWIKLLPYLAACVLLIAVYTIGHIKGSSGCEIKNAKREVVAVVKEDQNHAKAEKKVMPLSTTRLDHALSKFLYN